MQLGFKCVVSATVFLGVATAYAQIDGPVPMAWRWQQYGATASATPSPLVDGNVVYVSQGRRVFAIERDSGNPLWRYPLGEALPGAVKKAPVLVAGTLIVATDDGKVIGIDPSSGLQKWVSEMSNGISGQPVGVGKNVVFALSGGSIMALDGATGAAFYEVPFKILDGIMSPIYSGGKDSVLFLDGQNNLRCISISRRDNIWKQRLNQRPRDGVLNVNETTTMLYSGNYLVALNTATGSSRFQSVTPEILSFAPVMAGDMILGTNSTGKAYFFNSRGVQVGRNPLDLGSQPIATPTAVGTKFAVPASNGSVMLVDPVTNSIQWQFFIRPMNEEAAKPSSASDNPGGGPGGGLGGGFGSGGFGGGQSGKGGGGGQGQGQGQGQQPANNTPIISVNPAGSLLLAGKTLLVPAADGSLLAFDKELGVDLTPPSIKQSWPTRGNAISGLTGQEFVFKIDDHASGVVASKIKFEIDGKPYNYDFGKDGYLTCVIGPSRNNPILQNGRHTITVTAQDWMGNSSTTSLVILVDNALRIIPRIKTDTTNGPGGGGIGGGKGGGGGFGDGR